MSHQLMAASCFYKSHSFSMLLTSRLRCPQVAAPVLLVSLTVTRGQQMNTTHQSFTCRLQRTTVQHLARTAYLQCVLPGFNII